MPERGDRQNAPRVTRDRSAVVITDLDGTVYRIQLESGQVTSWPGGTGGEPVGRGESVTTTSPGAGAVAWDVVGNPDPGAGVYVLDTTTGARTLITPPPDLAGTWYGLDGWSPGGDLLAVEFSRPEDLASDETDRVFVVGRIALGLFDVSGVERYRLTPVGRGKRIGAYAWSPDGSAILYLQGTIDVSGGFGAPHAEELWIWSKETGKCEKLAAADGAQWLDWPADSLAYVEYEDWKGQYLELTREGDTWTASPADWRWGVMLGEHNGYVYAPSGSGCATSQLLAIKDEVETVIYEGDYDLLELCFGTNHLSFPSGHTVGENPDFLVVVPVP